MQIPAIKNAFENIQTACEQKLNTLYPYGMPKLVKERYQTELAYLKESEYVDNFEIYRLLSCEAQKCSQFFTFRGTLTGSYLIYLLGFWRFNPLPAHYYCPKCGHFETVDTRLFGMDLPEIGCPKCSNQIVGDGFRLPIESVWGADGKKILSFDYNISTEFLPFAKKVLQKIYPDNEIAPYGVLTGFSSNPNDTEMTPGGFIVLPEGQSINDYPDLLTYLEDGEPCLSGVGHILDNYSLKRIMLLPSQLIEQLIALQRINGSYAYEISPQELRNLTHFDFLNSRLLNSDEEFFFSSEMPKTYLEMTGYHSLAHSSYTEIDYDCINKGEVIKQNLLDTPEFQNYPCFTREDFFDFFLKTGSTRKEAFQISEFIRKGRANNHPDFDSFAIPNELKTLAKRYRYIFARAHSVETVLLLARLTYYMKQDSKAYSKVVFKKRK